MPSWLVWNILSPTIPVKVCLMRSSQVSCGCEVAAVSAVSESLSAMMTAGCWATACIMTRSSNQREAIR